MALTDEELLQQVNILATKTDESTNPNMVYKTSVILNKGLNPDYFSGQYTKIVNALNQLASNTDITTTKANDVASKVNELLLDTDSYDGAPIWEAVKELMGKETIIEGLQLLLEGGRQQQVLGLTVDDIGKVLSVAQDDEGNLITKAVEMIASGGSVTDITAADVSYSNENFAEITNVASAIDYLLANGGSGVASSIEWDNIMNKPEIASSIALTETELVLQSDNGAMSAVPLMADTDIDTIIGVL